MSFKKETLNWEELKLFFAVTQSNGLAGASRITGVSTPTLSRRMAKLEAMLGVSLFERIQSGYRLTQKGEELLQQVQVMEMQFQSIENWRRQLDPRPLVRITAGAWTSLFIARHMDMLFKKEQGARVELISGATFQNLLRHEADIAIRNEMPDQQGLVRQRLGRVEFAIYGSETYLDAQPSSTTDKRYYDCDWVLMSTERPSGSSMLWLKQRLGSHARITCGNTQTLLEAIRNDMGLTILPCFIGDRTPDLKRCSKPIDDLTHTQWLVSSEESRSVPHIRLIKSVLLKMFKQK